VKIIHLGHFNKETLVVVVEEMVVPVSLVAEILVLEAAPEVPLTVKELASIAKRAFYFFLNKRFFQANYFILSIRHTCSNCQTCWL
jgi:hypothetical protein